jgi:hypothetical protein
MKQSLLSRCAVICVVVLGALPAVLAQETVTIPKTRFEELERKEKELERLKGELSAAKGETVRLKKEKDEAVAQAAAVAAAAPLVPAVTHVAPPLNTLPPLGKEETVSALDLTSHYRTDAAAADARYRKQVFAVKGEIIGFEKPMLTRNYHLLLRGADGQARVVCVVTTPEKYVSVFTTQAGTVLTGSLASGARIPLARIGQTATLEGRCRGMDGLHVEMGGCVLLATD